MKVNLLIINIKFPRYNKWEPYTEQDSLTDEQLDRGDNVTQVVSLCRISAILYSYSALLLVLTGSGVLRVNVFNVMKKNEILLDPFQR